MRRLLAALLLGGVCLGAGPSTRPVTLEERRAAARARAAKIAAEAQRGDGEAARAAYRKVGKHSPAWDGAAEAFFDAYGMPRGNAREAADRRGKLGEATGRLEKAGCDDPLVVYLMMTCGQKVGGRGEDAEAVRRWKGAADGMEGSGYPAWRKCAAHARYVYAVVTGREGVAATRPVDLWGRCGGDLELALKEWPGAVMDAGMPEPVAFELAAMLERDWVGVKEGADLGELCEALVPVWAAARPGAVDPLVFKGGVYVGHAWEALGHGWGHKPALEDRRRMVERLNVAQEALEKAYAMDPADPRAATLMLTLELACDGARGQVELWWGRAMGADPDNYQACSEKLAYLDPKVHGSLKEMLAFGRECVKGGNWEGRIPFVLVEAHWRLARETPGGPEAYFRRLGVWGDMQSVYGPYLERHPDSVWDRSYYAYYAAQAGRWEVARKQFEILGDKPEVKPFGTMEMYRYLREKAKRETAPKW